MDKYTLSNEGRARFKRRKISANLGMAKMEGYEILDFLYEHGPGSVEEIRNHTGLPWNQVVDKIGVFIHHGFVEKSTEQ
jgi:DNA-binding MarR family transcriptional regulator